MDEWVRRILLNNLRRRKPNVSQEIEVQIDKYVRTSYDFPARLILFGLDLEKEGGNWVDYADPMNALRVRHHRKTAFLRRLAELDESDGQGG